MLLIFTGLCGVAVSFRITHWLLKSNLGRIPNIYPLTRVNVELGLNLKLLAPFRSVWMYANSEHWSTSKVKDILLLVFHFEIDPGLVLCVRVITV